MKIKRIAIMLGIVFVLVVTSGYSSNATTEHTDRSQIIGDRVVENSDYVDIDDIITSKSFDLEQLQLVSPISINGESQLVDYVTNNGIPGSGSAEDPYIFSDLLINGTDIDYQIFFSHIHSYVVIQSSLIANADKGGIRMDYSSNAIIRDNIISDNSGDGVFLNGTSDMLVANNVINGTKQVPTVNYPFGNTIFSDFPFAVDVVNSTRILVESNTLHDNIDGIWFWQAVTDSTIRNNTIARHTFEGAGSGGRLSHNNVITNNTIKSARYGVWLYFDQYDTVVSNNIINSSTVGILNDRSNDLTIINNTINRPGTGIKISDAGLSDPDNNIIKFNEVSDPVVRVLELVTGDNHQIIGNTFIYSDSLFEPFVDLGSISPTFHYNYYSEWTGPDSNGDGIVDSQFAVSSRNTDSAPRVSPDRVTQEDYDLAFPPLETSISETTSEETTIANTVVYTGVLSAFLMRRRWKRS